MYQEQQQQSAVASLNERLLADDSGETRDLLLGELRAAAVQIESALKMPLAESETQALRGLLKAVRLCESAIGEVWASFHSGPLQGPAHA